MKLFQWLTISTAFIALALWLSAPIVTAVTGIDLLRPMLLFYAYISFVVSVLSAFVWLVIRFTRKRLRPLWVRIEERRLASLMIEHNVGVAPGEDVHVEKVGSGLF